jgi:hypothetical protein
LSTRSLVVSAFVLSLVVPQPVAVGQGAAFHVLRIAAGPGGSESAGTFILTEERSTFSRATDKEVVVLFQWEGAPGQHKLEARWRSPDGDFTSTSVVDYTAKDRRFGAYWRVGITPTMTLGTWSIEATVDGHPAGRLNFEITDATVAPGVAVRRPLAPGALYERLSASFVLLTRLAPSGRELDAAGALLDGGRVLTAVKILDEVEQLRAHVPGGARHDLTQLVDLERQRGWAVLVSPVQGAELPRAADALRIGDRCYSMDGNVSGSRVLLEGQVTGRAEGSGLMVSFVNGAGTIGSPVVNEFGELLGLLGTTAMPRPGSLRLSRSIVEFGNIPMIPIAEVTVRPNTPVSTFAEARKRGALLEPLVNETHVLSGGFATNITRSPMVQPEAQRLEFSVNEKEFFIFVTWSPRARLRGQTMFRVYDEANRLVASSDGKKINFRPNELVMSSWRIPVFKQPGTYRAELQLDGKPAWRDYVQILP